MCFAKDGGGFMITAITSLCVVTFDFSKSASQYLVYESTFHSSMWHVARFMCRGGSQFSWSTLCEHCLGYLRGLHVSILFKTTRRVKSRCSDLLQAFRCHFCVSEGKRWLTHLASLGFVSLICCLIFNLCCHTVSLSLNSCATCL